MNNFFMILVFCFFCKVEIIRNNHNNLNSNKIIEIKNCINHQVETKELKILLNLAQNSHLDDIINTECVNITNGSLLSMLEKNNYDEIVSALCDCYYKLIEQNSTSPLIDYIDNLNLKNNQLPSESKFYFNK